MPHVTFRIGRLPANAMLTAESAVVGPQRLQACPGLLQRLPTTDMQALQVLLDLIDTFGKPLRQALLRELCLGIFELLYATGSLGHRIEVQVFYVLHNLFFQARR